MQQATFHRLLEINWRFYQDFASQFSDTRQRIQPGVRRLLDSLDKGVNILDLGCGNGELAQTLAQKGFYGSYTGIDFSPSLLEIAKANDYRSLETCFLQSDLTKSWWDLAVGNKRFDTVLTFAVLHHLPGYETRQRVVRTIGEHLEPTGRFIHSVWQFQNSPRLMERIQPWDLVEIDEEDLEPGDTLLDWRSGGRGLRYVHLFDKEELRRLAEGAGFHVEEEFYSDGERGKLGLYGVWRRGTGEARA